MAHRAGHDDRRSHLRADDDASGGIEPGLAAQVEAISERLGDLDDDSVVDLSGLRLTPACVPFVADLLQGACGASRPPMTPLVLGAGRAQNQAQH
jgi:hypothetical protein